MDDDGAMRWRVLGCYLFALFDIEIIVSSILTLPSAASPPSLRKSILLFLECSATAPLPGNEKSMFALCLEIGRRDVLGVERRDREEGGVLEWDVL